MLVFVVSNERGLETACTTSRNYSAIRIFAYFRYRQGDAGAVIYKSSLNRLKAQALMKEYKDFDCRTCPASFPASSGERGRVHRFLFIFSLSQFSLGV
ncbi:hypothetical protein SAMN05216412_10579 [Nitrosospira multiformis]|uniref:Uncharacterized protein n=1 Tax=Nitrosospira multiformis TaxID=1231 RepID=A0A1I0DQI6_9PROT|nr:hypothetical protein SAMN05216412_10579 [Nitrosospira multiformis]